MRGSGPRDADQTLAREDLGKDARVSLAYRPGQLAYERNDVERAYEHARSRARNL